MKYSFFTGLEENANLIAPISVCPNPFTDFIEVHSTVDLIDAEFCLFDLTGRKVQSIMLNLQTRIVIPRDNVTNGMYVYLIVRDNEILGKGKIIAQ